MMVHTAKLKLQQEFKQREKDIETEKRIAKAKAEAEHRVRLMNEREKLLQDVRDSALLALSQVSHDKTKYSNLLKELIVQGLIKMNEPEVEVIVRKEDYDLAKHIYKDAASLYRTMIKEATGQEVACSLSLNPNDQALPPAPKGDGAKSCSGGVKLLALGGKIVCDNTLDSRLEIAIEALMPTIRSTLFTSTV